MADFFPSSAHEAIAMLYVQNQDLSGKTPEELFKLFKETERSLYEYATENRNEDWMRLK